MPFWDQPAFYIAVVSLMANIGVYLKSKSAHTVAVKAVTELAKVKSHLIRNGVPADKIS
jgi:hypothetical protein